MSNNSDVVDALRHRVDYDRDKIYVIISHEAKEIFISSVKEQIPYTIAIYTSLTRMITATWQHNDIEFIIEQLNRSSMSKKDLPGILARLLPLTEACNEKIKKEN